MSAESAQPGALVTFRPVLPLPRMRLGAEPESAHLHIAVRFTGDAFKVADPESGSR